MIVIQAGHVNIEDNVDGGLRTETGAPGERELTETVVQGVVAALQTLRVSAMYADANFNSNPRVKDDYGAFVAVHFQAATGEANGFDVGTMDPELDGAKEASAKLEDSLADAYGEVTGLMRTSWCQSNPNVQQYYNFASLSANTPCVLIECSLVAWGDGNTDKIIDGIAQGILDFLGMHAPEHIGHDPTADALTNIGQALVWIDAEQSVLDQNTYKAISTALHAARKALGGE